MLVESNGSRGLYEVPLAAEWDTVYIRVLADVNGDGAMAGTFVITEPWYSYMTYTIQECDDQGEQTCRNETGFGGDRAGDGAAWWFYFDPQEGESQSIWAGQHGLAGTVTVDADNHYVIQLDLEYCTSGD